MSDQSVAFDSWFLILSGRWFIGRAVAGGKNDSFLQLCPCYELIDDKMLQNTPDGMAIMNMVEVQPIAGCMFDVPVNFEIPSPVVIALDELCDRDKNSLRTKIGNLQNLLIEKRSGLKLVKKEELT